MKTNSLFNRFTKRQLWHLGTVGGFIIGFAFGWLIMSGNTSRSDLSLATFWVYPAGGAGLGMGICQWSIAFQGRKNGYLWIPATAIGFIASTGATLTLLLAASTYTSGIYDFAYDSLVAIFTPIAPFSLLIGPIGQWSLIRDITTNKPYNELVKLIVGWVVSTFLLFGMFYLFVEIGRSIPNTREFSWIFGYLVLMVIVAPTSLLFARTTINAISTD